MQFRNKARTGDEQRHGAIRRDAVDDAPSTAWLEAQQAFSVPRPGPREQAVVIVRKGRTLAPAGPVVEGTPHQAGPPAEKVARVFRVVSAQGASANVIGPDPSHHGPQLAGEGTGVGRRRKFNAHKRPGPVLRTVPVTSVQDKQVGQSRPRTHKVPVLDHVADLREMLARVDTVLDDIRRARAFEFVDKNSASAWEQLSNAATAIQKQFDRLAARSSGQFR